MHIIKAGWLIGRSMARYAGVEEAVSLENGPIGFQLSKGLIYQERSANLNWGTLFFLGTRELIYPKKGLRKAKFSNRGLF